MRGYRAGDKVVEIAGQEHCLRLSVSSLAEMANVFKAETPKALAARLRRATLADWNRVLACVATPVLPRDMHRDEMLSLLPILSELITDGLRV